jgi:hypothetical protein
MPRWPLMLLILVVVAWMPLAAKADYAKGVAAYGSGDYVTAAREFRQSAEAGEAESQFMLGRLYVMGLGGPQDFVQAWTWQDRAARQGHHEALDALRNLEQIMNPAQLAQARALGPPEPTTKVPSYDIAEVKPNEPAEVGPPPASAPAQQGRRVLLRPRSGEVIAMPAATPSPPPRPVQQAELPNPIPASPTPASPSPNYERLLRADGGLSEQVRLLQRDLNKAGYGAGPVDGVAGRLTRQAIRAYQTDQGMAVNGEVSALLVDRLIATPPLTIVTVEPVAPQQAQTPR